MYICNKGTVSKPKWAVVESRRIDGKESPRQKLICTFGDLKDPAKAIQRWNLILDDARIAERSHWDIKFRNKKFPLVKRYARKMSFDEIKSRHDKIVATAERLEWQKRGEIFTKQLKIKKERGITDNTNNAQEFSVRLTALLETISGILADDNLKDWGDEFRERMRERLADIINFYHRL
jgi:hypothetical protein